MVSQYEYEVAQCLLENATELKIVIESVARKFYELGEFFDGHDNHSVFTERYTDFFCELLVREMIHMDAFQPLTYEELRSIVTPDLVVSLNGVEYFYYE